jgi:predicted nucleic acid-binding protein
MKVLLDTNVILDVLLQRGPWLAEAAAVWQASREGRLECCLTASALTDVYYICRKLVGPEAARQVVRTCLDELTLLPVDRAALEHAFALPILDLEDALQVACAARDQLTALVTRDQGGFAGSTVPIWSPAELIAQLTPPEGPSDLTSPSATPGG